MTKQRSHRGALPKLDQPATKQSAAQTGFQTQLERLLKLQKYRQALEEIKKVRRTQPGLVFTPSEAEIWSLRGRQEFEKGDYKQAETSFRRALETGLQGDVYYWIARSLLHQNRLDAALELIQPAFEQGRLPKEHAVCYLKLLLLKGETAKVEDLIKQSKRFSAAQLHWVRGVLALKAEQPEAALAAFQKIKRPLTPGDRPEVWVIHTQQTLGHWEAASALLGLKETSLWGFSLAQPKYLQHPTLQRLAIAQRAQTGEPPLTPADLQGSDRQAQAATTAIAVLQLIEREDYHNAAHAIVNQKRHTPLPELAALQNAILMQAGQQALQQGEPECTETFWQPLLSEQPFNPQLAVNLRLVLHLNGSFQEEQRLVTRLIKWVEQDGKQNPQSWSGDRLPRTLAQLHCYLADTWVGLNRIRSAIDAVRQAERIDPTSPEVIGRQGLITLSEEKYEQAVQQLTQALEQGCQSEEVYGGLLNAWEELGNSQAKLEARRRFGQRFGDLNPDADIEFASWIAALHAPNYAFFSHLVAGAEQPDPPMQACSIFVEAVQSPPNSGGRVSLNQAQAAQQWEALLRKLPGAQQISTLQAIALSMQRFAKREKGVAALIGEYQKRLFELSGEYPAAREAHLVVLAVRDTGQQKLDVPLRMYLETMPQPGNALAQLQLQARKFGWVRSLIPFLQTALQREPQNPLLLLARATTYPLSMAEYEEFKQQGFEIARRVQDAKALQAFREEEAFVNLIQTQAMMPDPEDLEDFDGEAMDEFLENMLRQMLGQKIPKAELERMLPTLKQQMLNELPDLNEDEDDEDGFFNFPPPKKRRRTFRDL